MVQGKSLSACGERLSAIPTAPQPLAAHAVPAQRWRAGEV